MKLIHRPTDLQDANPQLDRCVYNDDQCIARVYMYEHGPQKDLWGWFAQWEGGGNGVVGSLDEALRVVKAGYLRTSGIPEA